MRSGIAATTLCLVLAGCGETSMASRQEQNVTSSLQYDAVACAPLISQRNALAANYGLSQDAKGSMTAGPTGFAPFIPDYRSQKQQDSDRAAGQIDAMNRSLIRRACIKPPKTP